MNANHSQKNIVVTGATGQQGGAVARSLLARGHKVRALVRDENKPAAQELKKSGATLMLGNFDDASSLAKAMDGANGVFSVQNFFEVGFDKEIEQGCRMIDAARQSGIEHFVFSSVIGADTNTNIPHFESKWEVEKHLKASGLKSSVLRAVAYMDNWLSFNWYKDQKLYVPMKPDRVWQMIATRDIGEFAAIAFERPEVIDHGVLNIAGDEFTVPHAAEIFSRAFGDKVTYEQQPMEEVRGYSEEIALMFEWFNDKAVFANLNELKKLHPDLWTLEKFLRTTQPVSARS